MKKEILIFLLIILSIKVTAYSDFQDLGAGARPLSLGGAFTGIAEDIDTIFWNTAGIAQLSGPQIGCMYKAIYPGLDLKLNSGSNDQLGYYFLGYGKPVKDNLGMGIGFSGLNSAIYKENTVVVCAGYKLKDNIYLGTGIKVLQWNTDSSLFSGEEIPLTKTGYTLDLGALYKLNCPAAGKNISIGLALENVIPADMGVTVKNEIPFKLSLGAAYEGNNFIPAVDLVYKKETIELHLGAERMIVKDKLTLRLGYSLLDLQNSGRGMDFTGGVGLNIGNGLNLAYALIFPLNGVSGSMGTHCISINKGF